MTPEKKYPIYRFILSWDQEGLDYRNSVCWQSMFKEEKSSDELQRILKKQMELQKEKGTTSNVKFEWERLLDDFWSITWFAHETFNVFDSEEQSFKSFTKFVYSKKKENRKNGRYGIERDLENKNSFYCFMGAEERYRWRLCGCDKCKEMGKTIIEH